MARFSRLMAMLLQQQVPLAESLRLTANGLHDAYLARACRKVAKEVEQGRSISDSIAARRQFSLELTALGRIGRTGVDSRRHISIGRRYVRGPGKHPRPNIGNCFIALCFPVYYLFLRCFCHCTIYAINFI